MQSCITSFTEFQAIIDQDVQTLPLQDFTNLDPESMLPHIPKVLGNAGKLCFGLKVKKKKRGTKPPTPLIKKLRRKKIISSIISTLCVHDPQNPDIETLKNNLVTLKADIIDAVCDIKLKHRHKLSNKTLRKDPTGNQISSVGYISAIYNEGRIVFTQVEIEEAILCHFAKIFRGQRHPVFIGSPPHDQLVLCAQELDGILLAGPPSFEPTQFESVVCQPFLFTELEDCLGSLPTGKASGHDGIPHEFLKHSGPLFRQYLLQFLNKIILSGQVPSAMNIGKCMLIHKVKQSNIQH